jgi:hypothetical protein
MVWTWTITPFRTEGILGDPFPRDMDLPQCDDKEAWGTAGGMGGNRVRVPYD